MFNLDVGGKLDVRLLEKSIYIKKKKPKKNQLVQKEKDDELKIDVCLNLKKSLLNSKLS